MDIIIAGLGNPGLEYELTRHNIGFLVVDALQKKWLCSEYTRKWNADYCQGRVGQHKVHLIKPVTFMNRSGQAVAEFCRFYKIGGDQLIVIHDDLDMAPGRVKFVKGGGNGGHNGIKSIVQSIGTNDFYRLKYGIGRPGQGDVHADFPVEKYVLSKCSSEDLQIFDERIAVLREGLELFFESGAPKAMNILNALK